MESRFEELKKVILERAHEAGACREQYGRAYRADSLDSLMQVVRDNFWWATFNKVIDGDLIDDYKDEFNAGKIWHNESASEGFVLASGSASVEASGSASVKAYGSASVKASGSASVEAYDSASVEAYDRRIGEGFRQRIGGGLRQRIGGGLRQRIGEGLRQRICMFLVSQGMSAQRLCNL